MYGAASAEAIHQLRYCSVPKLGPPRDMKKKQVRSRMIQAQMPFRLAGPVTEWKWIPRSLGRHNSLTTILLNPQRYGS
ncbi:hypothetical protein PCANC_13066 [Puccinia coronata f. sp. avenae]|uniref:Uncharacterized protein n=1 Tax=Puccinia coronata f. sp. avenae TaxID=200324 RepID=A0A2N5SUF8_9BASI|nr:hypothetical protein PCANC_13066 [Puccinia coronata f. sp. avenae]PLW16885.1 hypothetical protein PCASD_16399 [Puccinia coronata f. sp. avenae]